MTTDLTGDDDLIAPVQPKRTAAYVADPGTGETSDRVDLAEGDRRPEFSNVYVFVEDLLAPMYARWGVSAQGDDFRWCAHWFEHAEAVSRLDALWQAFEMLRREPGIGPTTWWRDFADPTMAVLSSRDGPFRKCGGGKHAVAPPLPTARPHAALLAEHTDSGGHDPVSAEE